MTTAVDYHVLRSSMMFRDVSDAILMDVAQLCRPMILPAGETLFQQDSESDALYFLEDGQVHIVRKYPAGDEVIIATESPYYVIGELSMLANLPRTGSVVAVGDCELVKLSRSDYMQLCDRVPEVAVKALTHLGKRLYQLNLSVREGAIGNVAARVASVLLLLAGGENGPIASDVSVTRVARATAMDADRVERHLRDWAKDGLIQLEGRRITVNDVEALHNIAG